jgi:hypothetical protein
MKKYLLLTTAIAGMNIVAMPSQADTRYITTTTTYTYDFPDGDPVISTSTSELNSCPPVYYGGNGNAGGETSGGGMGGYADTDGDGYGDTATEGHANATTGNISSGYGGQTGSAGMGGDTSGGNSSSGGCFVTTAVTTMLGEPDDGPTLTALRRLRDHHVAKTDDGPRRIGAYYLIAPEIVRRIENRVDSRLIWHDTHQRWIGPIRAMVDGGRWHEAERAYGQMMRDLARRYLFAGPDPLPPSIRHYLTGR